MTIEIIENLTRILTTTKETSRRGSGTDDLQHCPNFEIVFTQIADPGLDL